MIFILVKPCVCSRVLIFKKIIMLCPKLWVNDIWAILAHSVHWGEHQGSGHGRSTAHHTVLVLQRSTEDSTGHTRIHFCGANLKNIKHEDERERARLGVSALTEGFTTNGLLSFWRVSLLCGVAVSERDIDSDTETCCTAGICTHGMGQ